MNSKVALTLMLVFGLWGLALFGVFLTENKSGQFVNLSSLFLSIIFGILIIKSAVKKVEQHEKIEKLTKDLTSANEKLKELDQLKSEFVSIVSHQVRTPMTVIKGYASLIMDDAHKLTRDKIASMSQKIIFSTDRTMGLVNNLLDMRRIEEGRMQYDFRVVNLIEVTKSIVSEFEMLARGKGVAFTMDAPKVKMNVKADRLKLRQVVMNLVENALKYTTEGFVIVSVRNKDDSVILAVKDSGRGIPMSLLPNLFKRFSRDESVKGIQGSGLGLYIAKEIITAHKGNIWAESEGEGKGATFFVEIPLTDEEG